MPNIPTLKPKDAIKILTRNGFKFIRQKGSHRIYIKDNKTVVVPYHNQDLRKGTLLSIIKQSGLDPKFFK
jgi:predicted RNA binding protein YcfA (HicA-like mRNA interferase family)